MPRLVQPAAKVYLSVPFGVPVGQKHNRRTGCSRAEEAGMHKIILRPGRNDLAGEREDLSAGAAIFGWMEHVVGGGRRGEPIVAVRKSFVHPGIQEAARIGFIAAPADVFQAPFERKDAAIVVGGPPVVLVAADSFFKPGHMHQGLEYRCVREGCQTAPLTQYISLNECIERNSFVEHAAPINKKGQVGGTWPRDLEEQTSVI